MSRLKTLLDELCPDGVEYKKLGDIGKVSMCKRILKNQTTATGGVPFYKIGTFGGTANAFISEELFEKYKKEYPYPKKGDILISAAGTIGRTVIFDGKPAYFQDSNIVWIDNDESQVLNKYLWYCYQLQPWKASLGGTIARLYNEDIRKAKIPVPPLAVQDEIVRVLDNFAELIVELTAELSLRRTQYEHYRDYLLTFDGAPGDTSMRQAGRLSDAVRWLRLGDIALHTCSGGTPLKTHREYYENGNIPWLRTQEVTFNEITSTESFITEAGVKNSSAKWIPANCVIIAISGASAGRCAINKIPLTTNQHCLNIEVNPEKALYKYVYYCVQNEYQDLLAKKEGARGDLNASRILSLQIPVPPLAEQERIVSLLDRFDALTNDMTAGLPAEIDARRKQYAYYRDRLLTFREKRA